MVYIVITSASCTSNVTCHDIIITLEYVLQNFLFLEEDQFQWEREMEAKRGERKKNERGKRLIERERERDEGK